MNDRVAEVQKHIEDILASSGIPFSLEDGKVRVERGSSAVFVSALPWKERYVMIELLSPMLHEVPLSDELLRRLNELNESLYFGKLYWAHGDVWLAHYLLGNHVDTEELLAAVGLMTLVADHRDDDLHERFGGRRYREPATAIKATPEV